MSFRDISMLALLLVVGLIANRCAFHGDAIDMTRPERATDRAVRQAERTVRDVEQDVARLNEQMEELGERVGEFGERIGELGEEAGESIGEKFENEGEELTEDIERNIRADAARETEASKVTLSVTHGLGVSPAIDLALDVPVLCEDTSLAFGRDRERTLSVTIAGGEELQSPKLATVDKETIALEVRGETPKNLTLQLPRNIPYLRFSRPQQVKLALSEDVLMLKLDPAEVGSLKVTRSKKLLILRHADWTLNISGVSLPLRFTSFDGGMLEKVAAGQKGEVRLDFSSRDNQGGTK